MRPLLSNQRGEGTLTLPILILIVCMVLYMGVDIFAVYVTNQKLRIVCSETLTVMKINNGWDEINVQPFYSEMVSKVGLDIDNIDIEEKTDCSENINRGDTVTLSLSTKYTARSLKPLNKRITIPINVRLSGAAQKFKQAE